MRLFNSDKVPVFLKAWSGATEKAPKHGETKIVKCQFAVPLTAQVASALVPGDSEVTFTVFKNAVDGSLRPFLRSSVFELTVPKQKLTVFSTPDTETASICFDQVKIGKRVTAKSGLNTAHLLVHASVGPLGPSEYAALGLWHEVERFVTFEEAEPALEFENEPGLTDADEKARQPFHERPSPAWGEDDIPKPLAAVRSLDSPRAREAGHRYPPRAKRSAQGSLSAAASRVATTRSARTGPGRAKKKR